MKLLTLTFLLLSSACFSQRSLNDSIAIMSAGDITIGQMDRHGVEIASKTGNGSWVILNPDALMKYYQEDQEAESERYYKLTRRYNKLVGDFNRLLTASQEQLRMAKAMQTAVLDYLNKTKTLSK